MITSTITTSGKLRKVATAAVVGLAVAVSGCGFDDVELNGSIFDMMGVGSNSKKAQKDVAMRPRAPLVLPPGVERLPQPGEAIAATDPELLTIRDPDLAKVASKEQLEQQQKEYCEKHYTPHSNDAEFVKGPLGPCRKSALTAFQKWMSDEQQ
jgi:hypothetical protein